MKASLRVSKFEKVMFAIIMVAGACKFWCEFVAPVLALM